LAPAVPVPAAHCYTINIELNLTLAWSMDETTLSVDLAVTNLINLASSWLALGFGPNFPGS
jgi:hypothetical protein